MIVTFRDAMGVVSMQEIEDVQFCDGKAYFTDKWGVDIKVSAEHLISITEEQAE